MSDFVSLVKTTTLRREAKSVSTFEDLLNVLLDRFGILSLTNNFQEIIVREEVESGEESSLTLQELIQVLLNVLELSVEFLKNINETLDNERTIGILLLVDALHFLLEVSVNLGENRTLTRQLLRNILLASEDALEVGPLALDCKQEL